MQYYDFLGNSGENSLRRIQSCHTRSLLHSNREGTKTETNQRRPWNCDISLLSD